MKFHKDMLLLYAVTDRKWTGRQTLYEQIEEALKAERPCIQLREETCPENQACGGSRKNKRALPQLSCSSDH